MPETVDWSITRGSASFAATKDDLFDALQSSCKDVGASVASADRSSYRIDGKSGTMWLQNRFSFKFHACLVDDGERVKLEVYDFAPICPDKRFIKKLLDKVATKVPPVSPDYLFEVVDKQSVDLAPHAAPGAIPVPSAQEIGRLMVRPDLVKRFEYKIKVVYYEGDGNVGSADRMEILPLLLGNMVNLYREKVPVMSIPISSIDVAPIAQLKPSFAGPRRNILLDLQFGDGTAHAMRLDVEDKEAAEIIHRLASVKKGARSRSEASSTSTLTAANGCGARCTRACRFWPTARA